MIAWDPTQKHVSQARWRTPVIPAVRRWWHKDQKFKGILGYTVSLRLAQGTQDAEELPSARDTCPKTLMVLAGLAQLKVG